MSNTAPTSATQKVAVVNCKWHRGCLSDLIVSLESGVSVNADDRPPVGEEPGVLKTGAVTGGRFNPKQSKAILPGELSRACLNPTKNTILISRMNTADLVGESAIVRKNYPNLFVPDRLWMARTSKEICDVRWLAQVLLSPRTRLEVSKRATGTSGSMKNIGQDVYLSVPADIAPRSEQGPIADVLEALDERCDAVDRAVRIRRKLKRGLMQTLLTGGHRFPEFAKSEQPWAKRRLREVAEECTIPNRGQMGRDRVMGVLKSRGIVPMDVNLVGDSIDRYQIVQKDWFAYNPMRLNIGSISRSAHPAPVLVSPDYVVFRCLDGRLDPAYLDQYRRGHQWASYMRVCGAGSVRTRIYFNDLGSQWVMLPPIEEQTRIAQVLGTIDREIATLRALHDALAEQKKGLMQKLLTGEVRVPASMMKDVANA